MSQKAVQVTKEEFLQELRSWLALEKGVFFKKLTDEISLKRGVFADLNASRTSSSGFGLVLQRGQEQIWITVWIKDDTVTVKNGEPKVVNSMSHLRQAIAAAGSHFHN